MATAKDRRILESVGHEMKSRPPRQLAKTRKKFGVKRANKQKTAILLNKARGKGAGV